MMRFVIYGHAARKYEDTRPIVTSRLGSLGWHGVLDHLHFRMKRPNTFSAVHHGLDRACHRLGIDVLWTEDLSCIRNSDIIFTEAKYIVALGDLNNYYKVILHAEPVDYPYIVDNFSNVFFWENYKGNLSKTGWEKIGPLTYYNNGYRSIQMPWASDVFEPIEEDVFVEENTCYYVGNFSTDALDKAKKLRSRSFKFYRVGGVSFEAARQYVKRSEFTFDVRNDHCIEYGFIPCRIFKNYSYGKICFTNSSHIAQVFSIPYYYNNDTLLSCLADFRSGSLDERLRYLQNDMLCNHTYLSRMNTLRKVVGF